MVNNEPFYLKKTLDQKQEKLLNQKLTKYTKQREKDSVIWANRHNVGVQDGAEAVFKSYFIPTKKEKGTH